MKKEWFIIVDGRRKRVIYNNELVPAFENAKQAENFIDKKLGGSPYVQILRTDKISKNMMADSVKNYGNQQLASWQNNLRNKRLM